MTSRTAKIMPAATLTAAGVSAGLSVAPTSPAAAVQGDPYHSTVACGAGWSFLSPKAQVR